MNQSDATPMALDTPKLWGKLVTPALRLITADDFAHLPDDGERHELMHGRLINEHIAPDLVVEVASPSQFRPVMEQKARLYLSAGVRLVWIIWPNSQPLKV